jgi:hypothetical protein
MSVGSAGTTLTSEDLADLRIQATYHIKKAEQIFSRIATARKNTKVSALAHQANFISQQIQELTKVSV